MNELLYLYKIIDKALESPATTIIVCWDGYNNNGVSQHTYIRAKDYLFKRANGRRVLLKVKLKIH